MFVDKAKIHLQAGKGGDGVISFLSGTRNPKGGPDGGRGGKGGDVVLKAVKGLSTLKDFENNIHFRAQDGQAGASNNRRGADGKDLVVKVPVGTVIKDSPTGKVIADLENPGQSHVVVKGGEGGRGNASFKSSTRQAPRICEKGARGEELWVDLELKLLADVGIIGLPNAGKSSLLSTISASKTKVASYPFTTREPHLGVVEVGDFEDFLAVDIPGLIEGAHLGKGLGDEFLRHVEKTKVLVHLVDISKQDKKDPIESYRVIKCELESFSAGLAHKPEIVVGNKIDLLTDEEVKKAVERFEEEGICLRFISAATGEGINELLETMFEKLQAEKSTQNKEEKKEEKEVKRRVYRYHPRDEFRVIRKNGVFVVKGDRVEDLLRLSLENQDALEYFYERLEDMGVIEELEKKGVKEGDKIIIGGREFEYG